MADNNSNQQRSWFGSMSNMFGSVRRAAAAPATSRSTSNPDQPIPSTETDVTKETQRSPPQTYVPTPSRTFRVPSDSPESDIEEVAKKASPASMAHRKLFDRPDWEIPTKTRFPTNFNSHVFEPGLFRKSVAEGDGTQLPFTFKPRIPITQLKFPQTNPRKPMRNTAAQAQGQTLDKGPPSRHFKMNIPEPDASLHGEAINKKAPRNTARSMYADEYLAHLCPSDFTDEQRRQFFCILDLRRLKYTADETMKKKDWRINMINFAKEYEKCRGLILVRYGLYHWKTVSKEALAKWKNDNKIQDEEEEPLEPFRAVKPTTQSVADQSRAGKRKAQDDLQSKQGSETRDPRAGHPGTRNILAPKKPRIEKETEREPLAETTTPALNKGARKAYVSDEGQEDATPQVQPTKIMSATRTFFEQAANTPHKEKGKAPEKAPAGVSKSTSSVPATTVPSAHNSTPASKAPKQTFGHSVFDSSLKPTPAAGANIFGYLSDASSAKGSGNDNADADAEGTSGSEAEPQDASQSDEPSVVASGGIATPLPGASLFGAKANATTGGSSASSESSTITPGKSLFDRIQKGSNGTPIRAPSEQIESVPSQLVPDHKAAMIEKQISTAPTIKTWTPDTPIKFGASTTQANPLFGSATPSVAPAGISSQKDSGTANIPNGITGESTDKAAASVATNAPTFGFLNKPAVSETGGRSPKRSATESGLEEPPAKKSNMFGSSTPAFGASTSSMFGAAAKAAATESEDRPNKRSAPDAEFDEHQPKKTNFFGTSTPSIGAPTSSIFGATTKPATSSNTESSAPSLFKPAATFSGFSAQNTAASALSAMPTPASQSTSAAASTSDEKPSEQPSTLFGAPKPVENKPASEDSTSAAPAAPQSTTGMFGQPAGSSMFGQSTQPANTNAASVFGQSAQPAAQNAQPTASSMFGQSTQNANTNASSVFGQSVQPTPSRFSILGQASTPPALNAADPIGQNTQPAATDAATVFGKNLNTPSIFSQSSQGANAASVFGAPVLNIFGQQELAVPAASTTSSLFGQNNATPAPSIFTQNAAPAGPSTAPTFSFGSSQPQNAAPAGPSTTPSFSFGSSQPQNNAASVFAPQAGTSFSFSSNQGNAPQPGTPSFSFSNNQNNAPSLSGNGTSSAGSSFTFTTGGGNSFINNPFSGTVGRPENPKQEKQHRSYMKAPDAAQLVEDNSVPLFSDPSQTSNVFSGQLAGISGNAPVMNFSQPSDTGTNNGFAFGAGGGNTTGSNTPFTLGGASSLATTPATGTPEPTATHEQGSENTEADGEEKQAQINLTDGAMPGEEDEDVVHEVRAKALRLKPSNEGSDSDEKDAKNKSPWKTMGVGPLRLLKHKTTGAARLLLRAEPRGHVVLNKSVLPNFTYKPEGAGKYVKITVSGNDGKGLETWMLQVKTKDMAQALADALETNKTAKRRDD